MFSNMSFGILSIVYILILAWAFFRKKHIKSVELNIFKYILLMNLCGLIIEFLLNIFIMFTPKDNFITFALAKIFNAYYVVFSMTFLLYVLSVCMPEDQYMKKRKLFLSIGIPLEVIISLFLACLPIYINYETPYTYGPAIQALYAFVVLNVSAMVFLLVKNIKTITQKNYKPLILYVLGTTFVGLIQSMVPELTLSTSCEAIIIYITYFSVENPDVKMVEQMELAKDAADKANRAKTDFLSSMSHEIRTPLNAIVGFSDCIMDAHTLNEAQENAKDIVNASQTLLEIVNGILDISKIEAGKIEIVNSRYNAPETFEELAKLITPKMHEKGLDFTYNVAPDLPKTLFGDHANIKKIVTNLLSNACKYTDKGFVHYEVSCINSKGVSKLIISVEDSGRGIKKDSIDKMFTKFQRLDEDRNTTIEGTGLGLAITKQLIELMGGRIIVHTVYGEGSKFTVVLNQRIETGEVEESKKVKTTLDLHNVRILIVDDTPLNIKVACKLLERYNANNLVSSDSGFDCIARIQRGEMYDLILLDDMMPKMSGVETLQKLKELPGFKIPTIALTANAITGMREKYLADGFDDYLAKPIEKEQMIQVFNQILGRNVTEELAIPEEVKQEAIRGEEIPNTEDIEKAEEERQKNGIIPVEENIEEILGSQVERNYLEKTFSMKPVGFAKVDEIEQLEEEEPPKEIPHVDLVPVVDINIPLPKKEEESYDRSYLEKNGADMNHALELLGDMDMYNMTIHDFMSEVEAKWGRILDYKEKNDMPNYAIEVHSLKSDCKYLGFMSLADIAYQHELKSKENDSNFVNEHFAELEEGYQKVLEVARTYVEHNPVDNS